MRIIQPADLSNNHFDKNKFIKYKLFYSGLINFKSDTNPPPLVFIEGKGIYVFSQTTDIADDENIIMTNNNIKYIKWKDKLRVKIKNQEVSFFEFLEIIEDKGIDCSFSNGKILIQNKLSQNSDNILSYISDGLFVPKFELKVKLNNGIVNTIPNEFITFKSNSIELTSGTNNDIKLELKISNASDNIITLNPNGELYAQVSTNNTTTPTNFLWRTFNVNSGNTLTFPKNNFNVVEVYRNGMIYRELQDYIKVETSSQITLNFINADFSPSAGGAIEDEIILIKGYNNV